MDAKNRRGAKSTLGINQTVHAFSAQLEDAGQFSGDGVCCVALADSGGMLRSGLQQTGVYKAYAVKSLPIFHHLAADSKFFLLADMIEVRQ